MTDKFVPRHQQKVHTWGSPFHGLNINGTLTLSNNETIYKAIDGSKRRFGDCYAIEVPGHTYADSFDVPSHLKFESYALNSGFEKKSLYNTKIEYADKRKFLYCDTNKDRWLVTISPGVGGTATAITMGIALRKFGDFVGEDEVYTYTLNVGNPAITTALTGYTYEVVNVSKSGNLAIIGLCLENSTTESQSTCIFDRQYGYPLAFIRLDLTSKTTQTASIYRSKTYCERTSSTSPSAAPNLYLYPYVSIKTEKTKNPSTGATIRTTRIFGEHKDYLLKYNPMYGSIYVKGTLNTLPANTTSSSLDVSWAWGAIPYANASGGANSGFMCSVGNLPYFPSGNYISAYRLIHVFIDNDNNLSDVECAYITDTRSWAMSGTTSEAECSSISSVQSVVDRIIDGITDDRVTITGDITSNTGACTISYAPYDYRKDGSVITYSLLINGSIVSSISFNSRTSTLKASYYSYVPATGTTSYTIPAQVNLANDKSYTGPSAGNITAVPTTGYKNYKGWMSKGTYTIDGTKFVTPFIQLYTNNLVGMIEGNAYTSNPDNAHWDTGSGGTMQALPIFDNTGTQVYSGGSIDALERYCSFHPINKTFSGLYDVPVCYV